MRDIVVLTPLALGLTSQQVQAQLCGGLKSAVVAMFSDLALQQGTSWDWTATSEIWACKVNRNGWENDYTLLQPNACCVSCASGNQCGLSGAAVLCTCACR